MTPPAESESPIGFYCSRRCSEPLESVGEARDIDFGGLNKLLSLLLPKGLPCYSLARFWVKVRKWFRPQNSISRASRTDSSGFEHLLEQEKPMRDSDSAGGVIIHTSFRSLHTAAAREFAGDL